MSPVKAIPDGYHTLTPALIVTDAAAAIAFYTKAFGAQEIARFIGPNGRIMHVELKIGNSMLMLGEEMPEKWSVAPTSLKGSPSSLYLYVDQVDRVFAQAITAGATSEMPVADMFWGDRSGSLRDPFGHRWMIGTRIENLTPEEIQRRGAQFFAAQATR